jgi:hypothetical protein
MKWIIYSLLLAAATASAEVSVRFSNTLPERRINVPITLTFNVDGAGKVTLDASTSSSDPQAETVVNGWDGAVGTVDLSNVRNSSFSIRLQADNGRLNLSEMDGGGIAISGHNSSRVDGGSLENIETLSMVPTIGGGAIRLTSFSWNHAAVDVNMTAAISGQPVAYALDAQTGIWPLADSELELIVKDGKRLELSTASPFGYALAGFSFDLVPVKLDTIGLLVADAGNP